MKTSTYFTAMMGLVLCGYAVPASAAESRGEASPFTWAQIDPLACPIGTTPTDTEITNACQITTSGPTQSVVSGQFGNPVLINQDIAYSFKLGLRTYSYPTYTYDGTLYFSPSTSGYYTLYLRGSPTSYTYRAPGISSSQPATIACSGSISSGCSAITSYVTLYMTAGYFYYFKYGPFSTTSSTAPTYRALIRQKTASLAAAAALND